MDAHSQPGGKEGLRCLYYSPHAIVALYLAADTLRSMQATLSEAAISNVTQ